MAKIDYRWSQTEDEFQQVEVRLGMVIAEKFDWETGKYREPRTFPHYDFSYVVHENKPDGVYVVDCGHNNRWWLSQDELKGYELVRDWHPNADDGVGDYVNDALLSSEADKA